MEITSTQPVSFPDVHITLTAKEAVMLRTLIGANSGADDRKAFADSVIGFGNAATKKLVALFELTENDAEDIAGEFFNKLSNVTDKWGA